MHECVAVIDLASEQSEAMKHLFQEAMKSSAFLGASEVWLNCYVYRSWLVYPST